MEYFNTIRAFYDVISAEFGAIAEARNKGLEFRVGQSYNPFFYDPKAQEFNEELRERVLEARKRCKEELPELGNKRKISYVTQLTSYAAQALLAGIIYAVRHPKTTFKANLPSKA